MPVASRLPGAVAFKSTSDPTRQGAAWGCAPPLGLLPGCPPSGSISSCLEGQRRGRALDPLVPPWFRGRVGPTADPAILGGLNPRAQIDSLLYLGTGHGDSMAVDQGGMSGP